MYQLCFSSMPQCISTIPSKRLYSLKETYDVLTQYHWELVPFKSTDTSVNLLSLDDDSGDTEWLTITPLSQDPVDAEHAFEIMASQFGIAF